MNFMQTIRSLYLKPFLAFGLLMLLCVAGAKAQSSMSDEAVMNFAQKEYANGTSREQIVTKLMQRGVNVRQIQRVRKKMESMKSQPMGRKDNESKGASSKSRLRQSNTSNLKKTEKDDGEDENMTPYQRAQLQKERQARMEDEVGLILPDDSLLYEIDRKDKKRVFGRDIFSQAKLSFEPNMNIATPSDYVLGAGDVVFVDIYGAAQKELECTVSPDGFISIEGYGPVEVSGLSVEKASARLRSTLGKRFGGSSIRLSLGQTKTIRVDIAGEVVAPGSYELSAFATVFHALYAAGGINDIGTLRNVKVYRKNRLISTVDIYDYILNGKLSGNVRLSSGDMIIVDPYECLINVQGKVKRPMIYEMRSSESVATALGYAGGLAGDAYGKNVRLVRRTGGEYSVFTVSEFDRAAFKLNDGDSLTVDSLIPRYSNMVEVKGAVFRPGMYQLGDGIQTVRELLQAAGGLTEDAFSARGVMHRLKEDRSLEAMAIDLGGVISGNAADVALKNEDVLFVPTKRELQDEQIFTIYGEVRYPGNYQYAAGTTLEDLVLQAGGLTDAASVVKVDVSRRLRDSKRVKGTGKTIAKTFSFSLKDGFVVDGEQGFALEPYDEVYVRRSPGYVEQSHVRVTGEIAFEGTYTLSEKNLRLSDLVKMAGGLTSSSYAEGASLERTLTYEERLQQASLLKMASGGDSIRAASLEVGETKMVGINLDMALKNPGSDRWDIVLREGDRLIIPEYSNTVFINGNVLYPNTVAYEKGRNLSYYIKSAGGYGLNARKSRVFVIHQNRTVALVKSSKDITPGSEIVVPSRPKRRATSFAEIMSLGSVTATLGAVIATLIK